MSPPTKARIQLHGLQFTMLLALASIVLNAIVHRPWYWIIVISVVNGLALGALFSQWRRVFGMAWTVKVRHLDLTVTDVGLWCPGCALPSGIALTGTELSKAGVTPIGTQQFCRRCGQPLEASSP